MLVNKKLPYKKMSKADYKGLPLKDKMKVDMKDQPTAEVLAEQVQLEVVI